MRNKEVVNSNPFFTVNREELCREDGQDTGYDALYRHDDKSQLSVVSRQYQLVPHLDAVDFVNHVLDDVGITEDKRKQTFKMASNGSKMFMTVKFPEFEFDPSDSGVDSTAWDADPNKDSFVPQIVIRNSYDKTTSLDIMYGAFRMACSNGVIIGQHIQDIKITHFGKSVDFETIRMPLIENLENTIDSIKGNYIRLNQADSQPFLENLILGEVMAKKYERMLMNEIAEFYLVDYKFDAETQKDIPVGVIPTGKQMTAYALWCVATEIASHRVKSVIAQQQMNHKLASAFEM